MDYDYWNNHLSIIGGTLISIPLTYSAYINKPGVDPQSRFIALAIFGIPATLGSLHLLNELRKGVGKWF